MKDIAGQTLGMDANEDARLALNVAFHEGKMPLAGQLLAERDRSEIAVRGRQADARQTFDELLRAAAILDEIGDGDQLQPVLLAVRNEIRYTRHRPVLVHDFADDAGRDESREPSEIDSSLRLTGPHEHASFSCA